MNKLIKQAFTLIELLVVIAIIGILSGLIVVSMGGMTNKATIAKAQVFSNSLRNALLLNTVAQYTFDDITDYVPATKILNSTAGNVPDSWLDNEGQAYGGPLLKDGSDCLYGKCLSFDGVDDYISVNNTSLQNLTSKTVILWIKAPSSGNIGGYVLNNGYWAVPYGDIIYGYPTENKITIYLKNTIPATISWYKLISLNPNEWTQIGYTWDGTNAWYILNGERFGKLAFSGTLGCSGNLILGQYNSASYLSGTMDDLRIFNAAVPSSQIKENYYSGLNSLLSSGAIDAKDYAEKINSIAHNE